jgi:plasmid stability protein
MDRTIRNLDPRTYQALKARAARLGMTVGEAVNASMRAFLARPERRQRTGSLRDLTPEAYAPTDDRLSEKIDEVVYRQ